LPYALKFWNTERTNCYVLELDTWQKQMLHMAMYQLSSSFQLRNFSSHVFTLSEQIQRKLKSQVEENGRQLRI
jgi:hypothetical protein